MTADPMAQDITNIVAALTRDYLREHDRLGTLARFRLEAWTLRLEDDEYRVGWEDGTGLVAFPVDLVARAVALLRLRRGDPPPELVN